MAQDKNFKKLKKEVFEANIKLSSSGLVIFTFGNVSGIDRERQVIAIKPSGVAYDKMSAEDMVILSIEGNTIASKLRPSSDTKTHLELYRAFPEIGGVAHTHSRYATAAAQAQQPITCLGTTHADYFYGDIPCTEVISDDALSRDYEQETGKLIIKTFEEKKLDYKYIKACLVACHGPFTWGKDADEAVFNAAILEEVTLQFCFTRLLDPAVRSIKKNILDKHFLRKHGKDAYYGQKSDKYNFYD